MHKVFLSGRKDEAYVFSTEIKIINNDWNKILKTTRSGSCFLYLLRFKVCDLRSKTKTFLVAFAKQLRSVTIIVFMSVRLAGFSHGKSLLPRDRFSCNFCICDFYENLSARSYGAENVTKFAYIILNSLRQCNCFITQGTYIGYMFRLFISHLKACFVN